MNTEFRTCDFVEVIRRATLLVFDGNFRSSLPREVNKRMNVQLAAGVVKAIIVKLCSVGHLIQPKSLKGFFKSGRGQEGTTYGVVVCTRMQ